MPEAPAYLSAGIITLVTLEALLVLVGLLMLDEGIPLMEHSVTVATLLALLDVGMLLPQVDTYRKRYQKVSSPWLSKHERQAPGPSAILPPKLSQNSGIVILGFN